MLSARLLVEAAGSGSDTEDMARLLNPDAWRSYPLTVHHQATRCLDREEDRTAPNYRRYLSSLCMAPTPLAGQPRSNRPPAAIG